MRLLKIVAVGAVLGLGGCIDMEMDTAILGPDQARVSGFAQVPRAMLDMMGGEDGFCAEEDGTLELTEEHARCNMLMEGTFAEVFEADVEGEPTPTATDLGDGTVQVVFPLGDFTEGMDEMTEDPAMVAMFRPMMEGHGVTLSISGREIVSTNGTLSADGTRASITFALTDLLEEEPNLPETFEAIVRY
ncbi:MAG: hypothetical protein JJU19_12870 [Pararhodobacter sp.]|nr:hypothetical protein [Pararhodobacter sp.]